jgi:hypothetical protein
MSRVESWREPRLASHYRASCGNRGAHETLPPCVRACVCAVGGWGGWVRGGNGCWVGGWGPIAEEMDREALVLGTVDYSGTHSYRASLKPGKRLPHIGLRLVLVPVQ